MAIPAARSKILEAVDILMRVPPILIMDELLRTDMGLQVYNTRLSLNGTEPDSSGSHAYMSNTTFITDAAALPFSKLLDQFQLSVELADLMNTAYIRFATAFLIFVTAITVFMLWTRHLVLVYMISASLLITVISNKVNLYALSLLQHSNILDTFAAGQFELNGVLVMLSICFAAQWLMGALFGYIHIGPRVRGLQKNMSLIFTAPILLAILPLPNKVIDFLPIPVYALTYMLNLYGVLKNVVRINQLLSQSVQYATNFISDYGLSAYVENEWQRLNVPKVLRAFWTLRLLERVYTILVNSENIETPVAYTIFQKLMIDGAETMTAVLGMTSIISAICDAIGRVFQSFLLTYENDEEKSLGTVSAVLFYLLALQTGLTNLAPQKRFVRLCRNFCLVGTAMLHFLHNIVSPVLMSLSAARNPSRERHVRALIVCALITIMPICMLNILWRDYTASTWLLAVTAFAIEVIVKVLVTLATYTLFLLDARSDCLWEKLDDYLYYVRAVGNSIEFFFGILLFLNGSWILFFESAENFPGGAIRAVMMCIHAYFNIWCEARSGWEVFIKRRTAVDKISALPEATPAELESFEDVCAICYQEMQSAKITRCRHYFHSVCLRKWLYVQDSCPLCHELMVPNAVPSNAATQNRRNSRDGIQRRLTDQVQEMNSAATAANEPAASSATAAATAAASNSANTIGLQTADSGPPT